jgi:hypothetical protein
VERDDEEEGPAAVGAVGQGGAEDGGAGDDEIDRLVQWHGPHHPLTNAVYIHTYVHTYIDTNIYRYMYIYIMYIYI